MKLDTNISNEQISAFLSKTDLFSNLPLDILRELGQEFEVVYLPGNEMLFHQHDSADCLYVLMFGFLRVIKDDSEGHKHVISEMGAGSIVGEIGCLFDEPRSASVSAVRDSVLLKMTRETFDGFLVKYPSMMMTIARQSVKRLVNPKKHSQKSNIICFSVLPAGNFDKIEQVSHLFVEKLSRYGKALLLTQETFDEIHGVGASLSSLESPAVISWIQDLESKYSFIVFVATEDNPWARRCIRQADKILLVGRYGSDPSLGKIDRVLFEQQRQINTAVELILFADAHVKQMVGTSAWFVHRKLSQHYNVRSNNNADIDRLIRLLTGNALGLVLSGGGALALAHVGVIRALEEAKIPLDYIGGTSMGGIIGAMLALEFDSQQMTDSLKQILTTFSQKIDYTLPISGLIKAKVLGQLLKDTAGSETMIDDLWQKFFCVSTNISMNELCIHDRGLLWKSLRKSISLPAIFPAVYDENNHVFVDGGILNNLPVDVMETRINGGKILASSIKNRHEAPSILRYEEDTTSGWYLLFKHVLLPKLGFNKQNAKSNFVSIATVIEDSMIIGSNKHQQAMIERADYNIALDPGHFSIMNFKPVQEIIDAGYSQAVVALNNLTIQ